MMENYSHIERISNRGFTLKENERRERAASLVVLTICVV